LEPPEIRHAAYTESPDIIIDTNAPIPPLFIPDDVPTDSEIGAAITSLKNHKAKGTDHLRAEQLKTDTGRALCTQLIQLVWKTGVIPDAWRLTNIVDLPKPDGGHRGIAITPVSAKVLTRIIANRAQHLTIADSQFGFRIGRCASQAVLAVKELLHKRRMQNKAATAIFLDITKAYDSVGRNILPSLLKHYGMGAMTINLLLQLYDDEVAILLDGHDPSPRFAAKCGVKQGCILSPAIFSLFLNEAVLKTLQQFPTATIFAYADDIVVLHDTLAMTQTCTTALAEELAKLGLQINFNKTKAMILHEYDARDSRIGHTTRLIRLGISTAETIQSPTAVTRLTGPNNTTLVIPFGDLQLRCPFLDCQYLARDTQSTPPATLLLAHCKRCHAANVSPHLSIHRLVTTEAGQHTDSRRFAAPDRPTAPQVTIAGRPIPVVSQFKYLGTILTTTGTDTPDITARISAATAATGRLNLLWKSRTARRWLKAQVFKTIIVPILMYNSCAWTPSATNITQIRTAYHKLARRCGGFAGHQSDDGTWRKERSQVVRDRMRLPTAEDHLAEDRLRNFGQMVRLDSNLLTTALSPCSSHNRRGNQQPCWLETVRADLQRLNIEPSLAYHPAQWAKAIKAQRPQPQYDIDDPADVT
jgi:hypothetical protein